MQGIESKEEIVLTSELKSAFYDWMAENHDCISIGGYGDLTDLAARLIDAASYSNHISSEIPSSS